MSMPPNAMSAALAKARAFNPGQPQPRPGFGAGAGPVNTGPFPPGGGGPGNTGPFPPGGGISTMPMPMPQMPMGAPPPDSVPPQGMPQMAGMPMGGPPGMPPPGNTGIVPPHMRQPMGPMDATSMGAPMARSADARTRFMNRKPNRGAMMNMLRQKMGGGSGMGMRVPQELHPTMPAPVAAPLS